jgi:EpsI family protein
MGEVTYIDQRSTDRPLLSRSVLLWIAALVAVALAAYWPASAGLWAYWTEEPSLGGHGPLVVLIAVSLLYRARTNLGSVAVSRSGSMPALVLLVLCSIAYVILWKAGIQSLELLLLPPLMLLVVWAAFGAAVARVVAVPIGYLVFAMPAWNLFSVPLQMITVGVIRLVAPIVGLPATVTGTVVSFPDGSAFEVTLACSGIGFLVQGLAVATLIGELEDAPLRRRLNLLVGVTCVALATNWVRVLLLLWLGYSSGMRNVLATTGHLQFGYAVFVVAIVAFVWTVSRRPGTAVRAEESGREALVVPGAGYLRALGCLIAVPVVAGLAALVHGNGAQAAVASRIPPAPAQWEGPSEATDQAWQPVFVGAHVMLRAVYTDALRHPVELLEVGYPTQEQGRELVNEENSLIGFGDVTAVSSAIVNNAGQAFCEVTTLDTRGSRSIIWSYYDIGGRRILNPRLSQLWYGVKTLYSAPYSRLIALRVRCQQSCDEARGVLAAFARDANLHGSVTP